MRLQGAIFDMDGTLLNSMGMWYHLGEDFLRSQGFTPRERFWEDVHPETLLDGAAYYKDAYGFSQTPEELAGMLEDRITDFYTNHVTPKPGVEKFLSLLKLEGVEMYIATNTDRPLAEAALRHTGLESCFRGMLTCAEVGSRKHESAEIFFRAMARLRTRQETTVLFEDSLPAIRVAKAAGFRIAGVREAVFPQDQEEIQRLSDYYVRSFEEMYEVNRL